MTPHDILELHLGNGPRPVHKMHNKLSQWPLSALAYRPVTHSQLFDVVDNIIDLCLLENQGMGQPRMEQDRMSLIEVSRHYPKEDKCC